MLNMPESCTRSRMESHCSTRRWDSFQEQLNIAAMHSHIKALFPYNTINLSVIGPLCAMDVLCVLWLAIDILVSYLVLSIDFIRLLDLLGYLYSASDHW